MSVRQPNVATGGGGGGMSIGGTVTSGTTGSVLFVGAGPVLAQDNSNFFWDSTNHRLGIGTTSPGSSLDIQQNVNAGNYVTLRNSNAGSAATAGWVLGNNTSANAGALIVLSSTFPQGAVQGPNETYLASGLAAGVVINSEHASGIIRLGTANTERMRIDAAGLVGINKATSIGAQLEVDASTSSTIGQIIKAAASQSVDIQEWQNSSSVKGAWIDKDFNFYCGNGGGFLAGLAVGTNTPTFSGPGFFQIVNPAGDQINMGHTGGAGELIAGPVIYTPTAGGTLSILGDGTGTAGGAYQLVYYSIASLGFLEAIYVANVASGRGTLRLMKTGGIVAMGGSATLASPGTGSTDVPNLSSTNTFTNKRITKRVVTAADATSITPNSDNADITYQANTQSTGTLTINADGGTPTNGQSWLLKIKSTNVQTFSWNSIFEGGTTALPTASTGSSKYDYYSFIYDTASVHWEYTGTAGGFA